MNESYKKISAPALGQNYGKNIKTTFENINNNFGVLANHEIVKGNSGTSLVSLNVPFSDLLDGDNSFIYDGYTIPGQLTAFTNMFKEVKERLSDITPEDNDPDVTRVIEALKDSGRCILISFEEPAQGTTVEILSSIPYVFVDTGVIEKTEESGTEQIYDLSGTILFVTKSDDNQSTSEWVCQQNFPTLYFDNGNIYWIIDNQKTQIPAQGPKGSDGKDGMMYVGLTDTDSEDFPTGETPVNLNITKILDSFETNAWESVIDYESVHGEIPDNVPILIIPDKSTTQDPAPQDPENIAYIYFIGTTYHENDALKGVVTANSQIYAEMNDITFKTSMQHIHNFDDGSNTNTLKGYTIKDKNGNGSGYMLFADQSQTNERALYLGRVKNIDSETCGDNIDDDADHGYVLKIAGYVSVEEGSSAHAGGDNSHAEGYNTTASGNNSHAEGMNTIASSENSHAEGYSTTASGTCSHVEGYNTTTSNDSEHAEGKYNVSNTGETNDEKTIHSIGIGTDVENRKNAVEVMQNGDVYIKGVGDYDGDNLKTDETNPSKTVQAVINDINNDITDINNGIVWEKIGHYNTKIKTSTNDISSDAHYSIAGGSGNKVYANYSQAFGMNCNSGIINSSSNFPGTFSCGMNNINGYVYGNGSIYYICDEESEIPSGSMNMGRIYFSVGCGSGQDYYDSPSIKSHRTNALMITLIDDLTNPNRSHVFVIDTVGTKSTPLATTGGQADIYKFIA